MPLNLIINSEQKICNLIDNVIPRLMSHTTHVIAISIMNSSMKWMMGSSPTDRLRLDIRSVTIWI